MLKLAIRGFRKAPCNLINCSGASDSVRSRMPRVRSSVCRISSFSSSVMVRMRSVRISSISLLSNKSPGLSGAISG